MKTHNLLYRHRRDFGLSPKLAGTLMGIASGIYLASQIPEFHTAPPALYDLPSIAKETVRGIVLETSRTLSPLLPIILGGIGYEFGGLISKITHNRE